MTREQQVWIENDIERKRIFRRVRSNLRHASGTLSEAREGYRLLNIFPESRAIEEVQSMLENLLEQASKVDTFVPKSGE